MGSRRRPSLESLRIFEACARLGGLTRAAGEVGLSQSAVSLRMRDLQADLGTRLFARTRPRLVLTAEGARLATSIARGLAIIDGSLEDLRAGGRPLRISVNPTFAARWLSPRLKAFAAESGIAGIEIDASLEIRPVTPDGPDVAIRSGGGNWPGLAAVRLMPIDRTPAMASALAASLGDHPSPQALLRLPLLRDAGWDAWFAAAGIEGRGARFASEVYPSQDLAAEAAASGAGVALLSPTIFRSWLEDGRLVAPFDTVTVGPDGHYAVYLPGRLSGPARAFVLWLRSEIDGRPAPDHLVVAEPASPASRS